MILNKKRIISTLCAVATVFVWCLAPSHLTKTYAVEGGDRAIDDVYGLDLEFGSFTFTYDYGVWDVNDMRYEASDTSVNPANGTVAGRPGWYGFDGVANRITVKNISVEANITVSLIYREFTDAEAEANDINKVTGVTMTLEDSDGWIQKSENNYQTVLEPGGDSADAYMHFSGEPHMDGEKYISNALQPAGMITVRIEDWDK